MGASSRSSRVISGSPPDTRDMVTRRRKKKPNSGGALGYCVAVVAHGDEHAFGGLGMCGAPVTTFGLATGVDKHACAKGHVGGPHASREELDREVAHRRQNVENMTAEIARFAAFEDLPIIPDAWCSECAKGGIEERQRRSSSGTTCKYGHGGAASVPLQSTEETTREISRTDLDDPGFEVREGDRLTVMYHGAKLQIAPYNSVELDGGIYSRSLQPGDDPEEQWDRIHAYLERKALEKARAKLRRMSDELHRARNNVETGSAYGG